MTKDANGPGPELIVLGRGEAGKPQAARFPAGHNDLVTKAAKAMNLTVCKAESPDVAELAKKLPTGRLYSTGRGFVPAVGRSLYDRLVEQLKLAGQPVPAEPEQPNGKESAAAQAAPALPTSWDDIAIGHLVIAYDSVNYGWWEAIVLARDGDMLTLKWRDYPDQANVVRHASTVALLKPNPVSA
jgi:hypothetical protein